MKFKRDLFIKSLFYLILKIDGLVSIIYHSV